MLPISDNFHEFNVIQKNYKLVNTPFSAQINGNTNETDFRGSSKTFVNLK